MDNKKIKVLAYCDSPTVATGFATVSRNILMGLHATGRYDVVILGINYFGTPHNLPFPIYPTGINSQNDPYGRSWAKEMMKSSEFDILFTLQDSFILDFMKDVIQDLRVKNPRLRWINYFPVDGRPKKQWIEAMNLADYPITYTKWGMEQCNEVLPESKDKIDYIYHGVNVKDFHPLPKDDVERFRRQYFGHLNSRYIICNVNRNQQRKDIPRGMQAFKLFKEKCPNALLYQHAATVDHGWNLVEVANNIGLRINEDICFPNNFNVNQGYPIAILNQIYNASDVVISSTTGEGWGLAQVEAMACCKPVISPDNTACTEIVGDNRGILVPSGWNNNAWTILPNDNEILRPLADVDAMAKAMENLYTDKKLAMELAINGYKWATSTIKWDKNIVPKWVEVFDKAVESSKSCVKASTGGDISVLEV